MRGLVVLLACSLVTVVLGLPVGAVPVAIAVAADLAAPDANKGATVVRIDGTKVDAEAWAVAHGHEIETVIVTRLVPQGDKPAVVETYERWSVDGKKKFERGNRKLGKAWEKHLWALLAEAQKGKQPVRRKGAELLGRVQRDLGSSGSRKVGGWAIGWSLGQGEAHKGGKRSLARIAVFTLTPGAPTPDVTPPAKEKPTTPSAKNQPKGAPKGAQKPTPRGKGPTTPAPRPPADRWPFPFPRERLPGPSFGGGRVSGSVHGSANSETGVRKHARVTVDLGRLVPPATKKPVAPKGPVTPKQR